METKRLLGLITLCGSIALIGALLYVVVPEKNMDLLKTFGVAYLSWVSMVIGYYFGSSDGSARKTQILYEKETANEKADPVAPVVPPA